MWRLIGGGGWSVEDTKKVGNFPTDSFFWRRLLREMKSGTGSGFVTLFSLIKNENIILFGGTEYSNEHTTEEFKILMGITKLLTYYVNCTFGSNVMVDAIVEHHCRFCSVLMVQQDSL